MEQRKYPRFIDTSLVMFLNETVKGEGRLDNLSHGGAAIISDVPITRGDYLALTIVLPASAGTIEIELAPVRWVKGGSFGVEFIRVSPGSQQRLKQYIDSLKPTSADAA